MCYTNDHARLQYRDGRADEVIIPRLSACTDTTKVVNHGRRINTAALQPMNEENMNPADEKLGALLRASRVSPALPPRFQDNVWRRIEDAEAPVPSTSRLFWLDALAALVLRPRFALAAVTMLIVAGALLGLRDGSQIARRDAQARYVAVVAPDSLR